MELMPEGSEAARQCLAESIDCLKAFPKVTAGDSIVEIPKEDDAKFFSAANLEGIESIGEGGQGRVIRARDKTLDREVAVKFLKQHWLWRPESQERLAQEAHITGNLEHPGVMPVYGFGRDEKGQPYYAMRYIRDERTLATDIEMLHQLEDDQKRNSVLRELLKKFVTACHTIDFAHSRKVIHRDIKPQNILLGHHEEVFVADWGLARSLSKQSPEDLSACGNKVETPQRLEADWSHEGNHRGTLDYMSPEQATEGGRIGKECDIFSLGATLYHILTGAPPYAGESISQTLAKVRAAQIDDPCQVATKVPPALAAICRKATSKEPADRYPSARHLALEVNCWLDGDPVAAYKEPWQDRAHRWVSRHRTLVTNLAGAIIITFICTSIAAALLDMSRRREVAANQELAVATEQLRAQNLELQRPRYTSQIALAEKLRRELDMEGANRVLESTRENLRGIEWYRLKAACRLAESVSIPTGSSVSYPLSMAITEDGSRLAAVMTDLVSAPKAKLLVFDLEDTRLIASEQIEAFEVDSLAFSGESRGLDLVYLPGSVSTHWKDSSLKPALDSPQRNQEIRRSWELDSWTEVQPEEEDGTKPDAPRQRFQIGNLSAVSGTLGPQLQSTGVLTRIQNYGITFTGPEHRKLPTVVISSESPIVTAAISEDGSLMATAHIDTGIRLWSVPHGQPLGIFASEVSELENLQFLPNSRGLVWTGRSHDLPQELADSFVAEQGILVAKKYILDEGPGLILTEEEWPSLEDISSIKRNRDGKILLLQRRDDTLEVWDTDSGHKLFENLAPKSTFPKSEQSEVRIAPSDLAINSEGNLAAVALTNTASPSSSGTGHRIEVIDLQSRERSTHEALAGPIAFHPISGRLLACLPNAHGMALLNVNGDDAGRPQSQRSGLALGQSEHRTAKLLSYPPNSNQLVMVPQSPASDQLHVWQPTGTGQDDLSIERNTWRRYGGIERIHYSPDGSLAALLFKTKEVAQIIETETWTATALIGMPTHVITDIAFAGDNHRVATAGEFGRVMLWDAETGTHYATLQDRDNPSTPYWFVRFTDRDKTVAAGAARGIVCWDYSP